MYINIGEENMWTFPIQSSSNVPRLLFHPTSGTMKGFGKILYCKSGTA